MFHVTSEEVYRILLTNISNMDCLNRQEEKLAQHLTILHKFQRILTFKKNFKNFMVPFLWMGFNIVQATEPLRGGSLIFTTKFPEIPGTHLMTSEG